MKPKRNETLHQFRDRLHKAVEDGTTTAKIAMLWYERAWHKANINTPAQIARATGEGWDK
jgi:hypothetical protein